ncbi:HlyD family secretion protein [Leeia oryzae]|uniref:HlyD family secretion protein n=1 Tax=Leeia oryzae TaxID=356662 RepID=UPI000527F6D7|nr:HlyD family efflux transporter periplasmic adaptor subunit [Leeia oryzae]
MDRSRFRKPFIVTLLAALVLAAGGYVYQHRTPGLPAGLAFGNGRLEATEVDVATKLAGRLADVTVHEGDWVPRGTVVARFDVEDLRAQLRAAEAQVQQARKVADEAQAGLRKSGADLHLAGKTLQRSQELVAKGFIARSKLDTDQAGLTGAEAGVAQAQSRVAEAAAGVLAAQARVDSLQATLNDTALKAPVSGRVLYRLAEPGEILAAGGKALTLVDLADMYMTIYLPTRQAGQLSLGSEARIVLDALPGQAIPARVSFVAPKAQFTPREVETLSEREKLMFRIKVRADPAWLAAHRDLAKGGMPGIAYVRLDARTAWPANLNPDRK